MKNLYLKALQKKYRFETEKGPLNMEQLFELSRQQLHNAYLTLEGKVQKSTGLMGRKGNTEIEEKLEIVRDVFDTITSQANEARERAENRQLAQTVLEKAQEKQIEELVEGKSHKQLVKLARKLDSVDED